jgi:Calcineurin-like phosphoesterase
MPNPARATPPLRPAPDGWRLDRRHFLRLSAAALGGLVVSGCRSLGNRPRLPAGFRFGLLTDAHYGDAPPKGTRYFRESTAKVREAIARFNEAHVWFVAELGDMLMDATQEVPEAHLLALLDVIEGEFRRFNGPTYHVLGNHDLDNLSKAQVLAHLTNTGIAPGRSFYSFNTGGVQFLVVDAEFLADGRSYDHGNYDWRDIHVPPPELEWLRFELSATTSPVIVFIHQRLDGDGDVQVVNRVEVRAILENSGRVLAVFQGHDHKGAYSFINGIHYYTLKAVVEGSGPENNAYAIVNVREDLDLEVIGYRRAVSMALPYRTEGYVESMVVE